MKAELRIKLNVDNAAFDAEPAEEILDILSSAAVNWRFAVVVRETKYHPAPYTRSHDLMDSNGNTVGQYTIQISEVD